MGIPSFFSYILKSYPHILRAALPNKIQFLFMDCNSIIYDCIHRGSAAAAAAAQDEMNDFSWCIPDVAAAIDQVIAIAKPEFVYIAFDGAAPLAKIKQQRERRFRYNNCGTECRKEMFHITPGTHFMSQLSTQMRAHFADNTNVVVSGADEPGEGEQKIFQYIRHFMVKKIRGGVMAIYGMDADLFMLSLLHTPYFEKSYFLRPNCGGDSGGGGNDVLDIDELHKSIAESLRGGYGSDDHCLVRQYIFACFLLGNDFLPKICALNIRNSGMQVFLDTLKFRLACKWSTNRNCGGGGEKWVLVLDDGRIHWRNVFLLMRDLARQERHLICDIMRDRDAFERKLRRSPSSALSKEMVPLFHREAEKYICPEEDGWRVRYYRVCFDGIDVDDTVGRSTLHAACKNYMEGIQWIWEYYTVGCPDTLWTYRYAYAPLLQDILHVLPHVNVAPTIYRKHTKSPYSFRKTIIPAGLQLLLVLPAAVVDDIVPKDNVFLQKQIHVRYAKELYGGGGGGGGEGAQLYPINYAFARYDHDTHMGIPIITAEVIHAIETDKS